MKIKTFFICSGLGVINRGYESFTRECFDALKNENEVEAFLFKGGGESKPVEKTLWNLPRFGMLANYLAKLIGKDSYFVEQFTFFLSLIPYLIFGNPHVLLVSDFNLSTFLWHFRKFFKLKYKILFSNGAPNGPPFDRCDHVQQLLPVYYQMAKNGGTPEQMMSLVPYGIKPLIISVNDKDAQIGIRLKLGIPTDAKVILSVGAINNHHKRMSYLIHEFSKMNVSNSFLIILGQIEAESAQILDLASSLLPKKNFMVKSVPYESITDYYFASDVFVLASLNEGFGRVFLEALSCGLPVVAHEAPIFRQVLGESGYYLNMQNQNELANFVNDDKIYEMHSHSEKIKRTQYLNSKYAWHSLKDDYILMLKKTTGLQ